MRPGTSRRASASAGIPTAIRALAIRGGYGVYYTQIRSQRDRGFADRRPRRLHQLHGDARAVRIPDLPDRPCLPLQFDPKTLPASQLPARDITIRAGERDFYRSSSRSYGLNFDAAAELSRRVREPAEPGDVDRRRARSRARACSSAATTSTSTGPIWIARIDLNAPSAFDRTAIGQTRTVAAANATRPILPVNGGVRQVNVLTNLGESRLQRAADARSAIAATRRCMRRSATRCRRRRTRPSPTATASARTQQLARLGEEERGPSVVDQRHRAVITFSYDFPLQHHGRHGHAAGIGASVQRRDRHRQQRRRREQRSPGHRRQGDRQVGVPRHRHAGRVGVPRGPHQAGRAGTILLRLEGFNLFNHGNILGRAQTTYGDTADRQHHVRPGGRGRHGDQRHSGAGQHRSAADVPVAAALSFLNPPCVEARHHTRAHFQRTEAFAYRTRLARRPVSAGRKNIPSFAGLTPRATVLLVRTSLSATSEA